MKSSAAGGGMEGETGIIQLQEVDGEQASPPRLLLGLVAFPLELFSSSRFSSKDVTAFEPE